MSAKNEFVNDLNKMILEVSDNLDSRRKGFEGDGSIRELEAILKELRKIKSNILKGKMPDPENRFVEFERLTAGGWEPDSELGSRLIGLAERYKKP